MSRNKLDFPSGAAWIGSDHPFDLHEAYLRFRSPKALKLDRVPDSAELNITADSRYKVWINGRFVARGPARCYPQYQSVDRLDVAPHLQIGPNTIAVMVYQPGYSHFSYVHRGTAGLLAHLTCNGETKLVTNAKWRMRRDFSFREQTPRISIYGTGVEERDLNLADDWINIEYDDSAWAGARVVAPVGGYPWTSLRLRETPLLVERDILPALIETRRGMTASGQDIDAHMTLRDGWFSARPQKIKEKSRGWYTVALGEGEAAYWLFDLSRDHCCQGWVEVDGAIGGEQLYISYAEKVRAGEIVISDPQTYCRVRMTDRFQLRPGSQQVETFSLRGGRYLLFQLAGPTGPDLGIRFQARLSEYPLQISKELPRFDLQMEKIMTLCETTLRACLQDGFIDCTWRESSQWLGDALPQSLTMAALTDDQRPMKQVIEMAVQGAYSDGILPGVMPGEVHAYTVVDYNFMWVELVRHYQTLTGNNEFIGEVYPALLKMLDRFHKDINKAGLLINQEGRRLFLDWAPLSRSEPNAVYNLHYAFALQQAADIIIDLDPSSEMAATWHGRAETIKAACRVAFWRGGKFYDDLQRSTYSQLANALALLVGAVPENEADRLLDAIAGRSLDPDDEPAAGKMVLASPFMHHYVFEALRRGGRSEQVIDIIRSRWGRWVEEGYPTTWENWNVDFPDGSQCHAFSAHPLYHLVQSSREMNHKHATNFSFSMPAG